jgi:hypothetical protein
MGNADVLPGKKVAKGRNSHPINLKLRICGVSCTSNTPQIFTAVILRALAALPSEMKNITYLN